MKKVGLAALVLINFFTLANASHTGQSANDSKPNAGTTLGLSAQKSDTNNHQTKPIIRTDNPRVVPTPIHKNSVSPSVGTGRDLSAHKNNPLPFCDENGNPITTNNNASIIADHSEPIKSPSNHFFIEAGTSAYYLKNPDLEVGTLGTSTAPLAKIDNNGWTPMYDLGIGYRFYNNQDKWLNRAFGNENEIEIKGSYFNTEQIKRDNNLGTGIVWFIDGSGTPTGDLYQYHLINFYLSAKHQLDNVNLNLKGYKTLLNNQLILTPILGVDFLEYNSSYQYTLQRYDTVPTDALTDNEEFYTRSQYFGINLGSELSYRLIPKLSVFSLLDVMLYHVTSHLTAHQNAWEEYPLPDDDYKKNVSSNDTKDLTYRAIFSLGLNYNFLDKPTSPGLQLEGGLDHWDYNPQIVPPNNTGSPAVHLIGTTQNNTFIRLGVTLPIA